MGWGRGGGVARVLKEFASEIFIKGDLALASF